MQQVTVTPAYLGDAFCSTLGPLKTLVENHLYFWCSQNVNDYNGGCWETVSCDGGVYRRLVTKDEKLTVHNKGAFWSAEVSADCMSVIATICALNLSLWDLYHDGKHTESQELEKRFYALRNWAFANHPEASEICMAID